MGETGDLLTHLPKELQEQSQDDILRELSSCNPGLQLAAAMAPKFIGKGVILLFLDHPSGHVPQAFVLGEVLRVRKFRSRTTRTRTNKQSN